MITVIAILYMPRRYDGGYCSCSIEVDEANCDEKSNVRKVVIISRLSCKGWDI